jgi:hypothetical protein
VPPPDSPRGSPKRPSSDSAVALYTPLRFGTQAPTRPLRSPPVAGLPRYCCLLARLRPPCPRCCPGVLAQAWLGAINAVALLVPPLPPSHRRRPQARASGTIASPHRRLSEVLWLLVKPLSPSSLLPLAWCPWLGNLILLPASYLLLLLVFRR